MRDYTAEQILAEMMEKAQELPYAEDIDTSEGSLISISCTKQALMLESTHLELSEMEDNLHVNTMDIDHLILEGEDLGRPIIPATPAIVKGTFSQLIPIGTRFNCDELNYKTVERISGYDYKLECEQTGVIGNQYGGNLYPIDFVDNYQGGVVAEVLIPGAEQEDAEVYRARLIAIKKGDYFGGNRTDYKRFITEIQGVGACKVKRRAAGEEHIKPYILDANFGVPTQTLINAVQEIVDPITTSGDGDGVAPIGHKVRIQGGTSVTVNITATLTYDSGYSYADVKSQVEAAVDGYFMTLAKNWENVDTQYCRIAQVESAILDVEGIIDITNTRFNNSTSNINLQYSQIPVRGTINGQ